MKCSNMIWPCQNRKCHYHIHADNLSLNLEKCNETDKSRSIGNCTKLINSPWTLEEIAKVWGITRERVRQIEEEALNKLTLSIKTDLLAEDHNLLKQLEKRRNEIRLRIRAKKIVQKMYNKKAKEKEVIEEKIAE